MKAFAPIDNLVNALLTELSDIVTPKPCRECATEYHLKLHLLPALAIADEVAAIADEAPLAGETLLVEPTENQEVEPVRTSDDSISIPAIEPTETTENQPIEPVRNPITPTDRTPTIERPSARVAVHRHYDGELGGIGIGFDRKSSAKEWGDCLKLKADIYSYSIEESRFPEFKYELRSVSWDATRLDKLLTYHFNLSPISHKPYREPEKKTRKPKLMSEQLAVA